MAKPRGSDPNPPVVPEEASEDEETSSEEEEEKGGEEEKVAASESESESESKPDDSKKPLSTPTPAAKKPDSSSSEDETDSEAESDGPGDKPDPNVKPIASKPVEDLQKATPARNRRSKQVFSSTTKSAGAKRPASSETVGDGEAKETKKSKKKEPEDLEKKGTATEESRKSFQRLWSEDDEIAILKGMIDYSAKKKADPVANVDAFHEFIKKSLHIEVSRQQLQDKIRRMRKKYSTHAEKEGKGKEITFPKDHEQKAYELSKKVWGNENSTTGRKLESPKFNGEVVKRSRTKSVNAKSPVVEVGEAADKEGKNSGGEKDLQMLKGVKLSEQKLGIKEWILDNSVHFVDGEKRAKMDEKWRDLMLEEAQIYAKRLELMLEETNLIVDALKSSKK